MERPLCRELWGSREVAQYREGFGGRLERLRGPGGNLAGRLRRAAARVLLPQGFPDSVSPDYVRYQCWDSAQALCSSLSGSLSTRALLTAVGVGDASATVTGAALAWLLRDGVGIVTRITFAWLQGSHLDCEAKQWRLAADLLNDVALVMELLAPVWPRAGPALLLLAAAVKCVVGVAGGATRAALAVHQARSDNVADVAAKDGSQETLVNGVGLLLALVLLPLLDGRPWLTAAVAVLLVVGHVVANVGAVRSLCLRAPNRPRLRLALRAALRGGATPGGGQSAGGGAGEGAGLRLQVPPPEEVNRQEPLLPGFGNRLRIHLGAPLHLLVQSEAEFRKALECGTDEYIIVLKPWKGWVGVGLRAGAPPEAMLRAMGEALLLEELLGSPLPSGGPMNPILSHIQSRLHRCPPGSVPWAALRETTAVWGELGPNLLCALSAAGWELQRPLLAPDEWRLRWP